MLVLLAWSVLATAESEEFPRPPMVAAETVHSYSVKGSRPVRLTDISGSSDPSKLNAISPLHITRYSCMTPLVGSGIVQLASSCSGLPATREMVKFSGVDGAMKEG